MAAVISTAISTETAGKRDSEALIIRRFVVSLLVTGNEEQRMFMREHAVKEDVKGTPLPPQFFYNEEYLGVSYTLHGYFRGFGGS